jgi:hypothetical protein
MIVLVKYRDAGMASYTYFWKDSNNHVASPYFDSEDKAMAWTKQNPDPKALDDARAEDEAFAEIARKQR